MYTESEKKRRGRNAVPWYWILIILSAVIGPFESYYVINKALRRKKEREKKAAEKEAENRKNP